MLGAYKARKSDAGCLAHFCRSPNSVAGTYCSVHESSVDSWWSTFEANVKVRSMHCICKLA